MKWHLDLRLYEIYKPMKPKITLVNESIKCTIMKGKSIRFKDTNYQVHDSRKKRDLYLSRDNRQTVFQHNFSVKRGISDIEHKLYGI